MKLIVYHIYCVDRYLEIVENQIKRIVDSGLYEWCDTFEVTCTDINGQYTGIDEIFSKLDKVNITKTINNEYEYWAIKKIWDLSQTNEGKVFYFHTKGVSNKYKNLITKEISEWKSKGVKVWKEMLEYFLIDNHQDCVSKLDEFDSCGVTCNNHWYSGNFWWANLSFIKDNPQPGTGSRWFYEDWLNRGRTYKSHEYYHFDYNGYFSFIPDYAFKDGKKLNDFDCYIKDAYYGTIDVQQDEGYSPNTKETLIDVTDKIQKLITSGVLKSVVDNGFFGDPVYAQKKYLIINFTINNEDCRVVYNEGWGFDISFLKIKKSPKILFLAHTSKKYDGHNITIEDSSLTRKMACLETWVPQVERFGHEVIFFQGGSNEVIYDEKNRVLHLPIGDSYDYNPPKLDPPKSLMLERLIESIKWSLNNKDFDFIFRTDDGSYINAFNLNKIYDEIKDFDFVSNSFKGGGGMFFSKKLCQDIVSINYNSEIFIEDIAIIDLIRKLTVKIKDTTLLQPQYVLGEDLFSIHYTNGKRMYFTDYTIKRYFNEDNNSRKILINYPIDSFQNDGPNTWSYTGGLTPRWFSYTTNNLNWEHYGQLIRSNYEPRVLNPFGKNTINKLVFYKTLFETKNNEANVLLSYLDSINKNGELIFFLDGETEKSNEMIEFLKSNNFLVSQGLSQINFIVDSNEITQESGFIIKITKHE